MKVIIVAPEFTKVYGSADQFIVTIYDENQQPIGNKTIKLIIDGVTYTNTSDYDGKVAFDINLDAGEYAPTVKFDGDSDYGYKQVLGDITVTKKPTAFTAAGQTVLLTAVKSGSYYNIVLKDNSGKVLANKEVTITFNGKTSKVKTGSNGVIKYTKKGKYKAKVKFAGNNYYKAVSKKVKITLK